MLRALFALASLLLCATSVAQSGGKRITVTVGDAALSIAAPKGFVRVTAAQPRLLALGEQITPPTNRLLAYFVSAHDLQALAGGNGASFDRYFLVQTSRKAESHALSRANFAELRGVVRNQQAEMLRKLEPRIAQLSRRIEQARSRESGARVELSVGEIVPLGVYQDTESAISFGMMSRVRYREGAEADERTIINVSTIVSPKGKLLFLYTYAKSDGPADLDWAKRAAASWARTVIALNR